MLKPICPRGWGVPGKGQNQKNHLRALRVFAVKKQQAYSQSPKAHLTQASSIKAAGHSKRRSNPRRSAPVMERRDCPDRETRPEVSQETSGFCAQVRRPGTSRKRALH